MKLKSLGVWFGAAFLVGLLAVLGEAAWTRRAAAVPAIAAQELTRGISVTEQIQLSVLPAIKANGFASVIDLRPDGEAVGQPNAIEVERAAKSQGLSFSYVPVPHGAIPSEAVSQLAEALSNSPQPVLLYCRSGKRAARTWALVEASRGGGQSASAIKAAVANVGQPVDDIAAEIDARVNQRPAQGAR